MLKKLLTDEMVQFTSEVKNWEEAIRIASLPLLNNGSIETHYVDTMISNVKEFGPYIVLMPQLAMPHARPEDGVNRMGLSLLVSESSVSFDGGKEANVFLVLAANDTSSHLQLLTEISEVLSDQEKVDALVSLKNYSDLIHIL